MGEGACDVDGRGGDYVLVMFCFWGESPDVV